MSNNKTTQRISRVTSSGRVELDANRLARSEKVMGAYVVMRQAIDSKKNQRIRVRPGLAKKAV